MDKFWKLVEKSTIFSGFVAMAMVGTGCYCVITQTPLPEYFSMALGMIVGFFFSSKMSDAQRAGSSGVPPRLAFECLPP